MKFIFSAFNWLVLRQLRFLIKPVERIARWTAFTAIVAAIVYCSLDWDGVKRYVTKLIPSIPTVSVKFR